MNEGSERHVTEREADQLDAAADAEHGIEEPSAADDAELASVDADDAAGDTDEVDDAAEAADTDAEAEAEAEADAEGDTEVEVDPVEEMRAALRRAPGDWYVVHSYAGYENKVKSNLETRIQTLDVEDYIYQVEVPTEEVTEIKNGQRKQVQRKVLPGYILVRMELNDQSWTSRSASRSP
jgi:transcriptional antiterminator NusG